MQLGNVHNKGNVRFNRQNGWGKPVLLFVVAALAAVAGTITYQHTRADFETVNGSTYRWQSLEGEWLVINYFAEWCAPCLREMPQLNALSAKPPAKTRIFALNYDLKPADALQTLAQKYDIQVELIIADQHTSLIVPRPEYLPATYIVGPDGNVQEALLGEVSEAGLRDTLAKLQSQTL